MNDVGRRHLDPLRVHVVRVCRLHGYATGLRHTSSVDSASGTQPSADSILILGAQRRRLYDGSHPGQQHCGASVIRIDCYESSSRLLSYFSKSNGSPFDY